MVKILLRLEGLAVFLFSIYFYNYINGNWLLFILLFMAPDISAIGYTRDKSLGATIYNLVHNFVLVFFIIFVGIVIDNRMFMSFGVILSAHIGIDRAFQYGLKYKSDFKDTHIKRL